MMAQGAAEPLCRIAELTDRQLEVLDLLLQHKTSKEIARDLSISPHTVEQRIRLAKEKLGVHRRSDLATAYRRLKADTDTTIYYKSVYDDSRIARSAVPLPEANGPTELLGLIERNQQPFVASRSPESPHSVQLVPAIFEGPTGVLMRFGAVFAIAAAVIVIGIGGLAVLEQLSRLVA